MKKIRKSHIFAFLLGAVLFGSIVGVSATILYQADEIGFTPDNHNWNVNNLEDALNNLYNNQNNNTFNTNNDTVCMLYSGTSYQIGSKYLCLLGDGVVRYFYILSVNGDIIKLIMEKNITDEIGINATMTYDSAIHFFDQGHDGYNTKQTWLTKVQDVDLPNVQEIVNAGGITNIDLNQATDWSYFGTIYGETNQSDTTFRANYKWLYNYVRGCINYGSCDYEYNENDTNHAYGYWLKNLVTSDSTKAWTVGRSGSMGNYSLSTNTILGVRPVITISKSKLAG